MVLASFDRIEEAKQEIHKAREMIPEATFEGLAETLSYSASHHRMGEVFVEILRSIWPEEERA